MSWREVLGDANNKEHSHTQNTHNTQKSSELDNSAYIADCAESNSKLLETLSPICSGLTVSPIDVYDALSKEDILDWVNGDVSYDNLVAFVCSLAERSEIDNGRVPVNYTERGICKLCGQVWLPFSAEIDGCPWCWNRAAGKAIPRPKSVSCDGCLHFIKADHSHLGHCRKGKAEVIAGLWDTDLRYCNMYLPKQENNKE